MKSEFTDNERLILIGLLAVAKRQVAQIEQTEDAIAELIGDPEPKLGRAADAVFGETDDPVAAADHLIEMCKFDAEQEKGRKR